ncbi:MAG: DUF790 family protein [Nitrososphaerota archaeon]|jgi:predicted nuclease of restriction endonuclease-like RecB superfamily|nr:DUF790 family protein [Nitrososphaerota archaeon]
MLPSNLLIVNKRNGEIQPKYAKPTPENLNITTQLIKTYNTNIEKKKKDITIFTTELENQGHDYRFIRALTLLLERKSCFVCNSKINPYTLRKKIFQTTEKHGIPTTQQKRQHILNLIATETTQTIDIIEEQLYADLDTELFLEKFNPPTPIDLLQQYNTSLTQTLLFECSELTFTTTGNWQQLFYTIKKLGLIYEITKNPQLTIKIDGPSSLFKLSKRYGTNIAKLLPCIITNKVWTIHAKILWKYTNEICNFEINHIKHNNLLLQQNPNLPKIIYDSTDEERFANQFKAINSGWILKREPEPIQTGNQILIPDFSLEKSNLKIYLEIIGFWTKEYLQRKTEKLKQIDNNIKMILLIQEKLACEKLVSLEKQSQLHLIYYKDKIPLAPIIRYLHKEFEETKTTETKLLKDLNIQFTEPIIDFTEFANRTGLSIEAIREVLTTNPPTGYLPLSNGLISKDKLCDIAKKLDQALKQTKKLNLNQVTIIIENEGVADTTRILEHLDYKIKWHGINSEQAEIIPPNNHCTFSKNFC